MFKNYFFFKIGCKVANFLYYLQIFLKKMPFFCTNNYKLCRFFRPLLMHINYYRLIITVLDYFQIVLTPCPDHNKCAASCVYTVGMEKVSVITSVYNGARYVEQCVHSLQQQTYKNLEMLFVDDGSTDGSASLLRRFAAGDPRIHVISLHENSGASHARNAALKHATGTYVCMLDVDDTYSPDAIECAVRTMHNSGADIVLFRFMYTYTDGTPSHLFPLLPAQGLSGIEALRGSINWQTVHGIYMIRTDVHRQYPYDESCRLYSDDNTARLHFLHAHRVVQCDGTYYYLQHPASSTHSGGPRYLDRLKATEHLRTTLLDEGVPDDVRWALYDKSWMMAIDCYLYLTRYRESLTTQERQQAMRLIREVWRQTPFRHLPKAHYCKFGFLPLRPFFFLFRAQARTYFFLRKLAGKG